MDSLSHQNQGPEPPSGPPLAFWAWTNELTPRSCLLVNWLADLGAVPDPGEAVRDKAQRFSQRLSLVEVMATHRDNSLQLKAQQLINNGDLAAYVAWFWWMRFVETVPHRFVLPGGRERVLDWVKSQLRRPELTPQETLRELHWRADLMHRDSGEEDLLALLKN